MRASGTAVIDGPAGTNSGEERYLGYAEALAVAGLQVDPAIAHCGLPWVDEALFMLTKHPNFSAELSYFIATITEEELLRFLIRAQASFVPLEKLFFGTDYPGFLYDPVALRDKLLAVNDHAERMGVRPISAAQLDGLLGDNYARMLGLSLE